MIVEIPGHEDWRIAGSDNDWQIQTTHKNGKSAGEWYGTNFFGGLEYAVGFAYERILRESGDAVDLADVPAECARAKDELLKAVRRALKEAGR